jgi:hypothetical protein
VLCVSVLGFAAAPFPGHQASFADPANGLRFGVLGSQCEAHRVNQIRGAGLDVAEMRVYWSRFEPSPGRYDDDYLSGVANAIERCRRAGIDVVLNPGVQDPPPWLIQRPGMAYVDQWGQPSPDHVLNLVFSDRARQMAGTYVQRLSESLHLNSFFAIRVGTSEQGELGYPASSRTGTATNAFWAFDAAAQTGRGLPAGTARSPMPGWAPAAADWRARQVSEYQIRNWFDWYSRSVVAAVAWEVAAFRQDGYHGDFHVPLAGRGLLPGDLKTALTERLDGSGARDGSLGRGLFYPDQLPLLARATAKSGGGGPGAVLADVTSLDDSTAVLARRMSPPQDTCHMSDARSDLLTRPDVATWSSFRWTVANARRAGLDVVGENPGPPSVPGTGGDPDSDSLREQAVHAPRYAQECGLRVMMWAFEDDLFGDPAVMTLGYLATQLRALQVRR